MDPGTGPGIKADKALALHRHDRGLVMLQIRAAFIGHHRHIAIAVNEADLIDLRFNVFDKGRKALFHAVSVKITVHPAFHFVAAGACKAGFQGAFGQRGLCSHRDHRSRRKRHSSTDHCR